MYSAESNWTCKDASLHGASEEGVSRWMLSPLTTTDS